MSDTTPVHILMVCAALQVIVIVSMFVSRKIIVSIVVAVAVVLAGIIPAGASSRSGKFKVVVRLCQYHPKWLGYSLIHYRVFYRDHADKRSSAMFNHFNVDGIIPETYGQVSDVKRYRIVNGRFELIDHVNYFGKYC